MSKPKFAVFDIDGTLVRWQFFHAIVHELGKQKLIDKATHDAIRTARMQWKTREHSESFREYESVLVHGYMAALEKISEAKHEAVIDTVFGEYKDQLFTYTRNLLRHLQSGGYTILAISGSHEAILRKLAAHIGIDDFIGANFEFIGGTYSGKGSTPIHDKAAALRTLVEKHDLEWSGSYAIGDSESDIAMLEIVENPIAFNPAKGLFEHAKAKGWKIVVERKNVVYELESRNGTYVLA